MQHAVPLHVDDEHVDAVVRERRHHVRLVPAAAAEEEAWLNRAPPLRVRGADGEEVLFSRRVARRVASLAELLDGDDAFPTSVAASTLRLLVSALEERKGVDAALSENERLREERARIVDTIQHLRNWVNKMGREISLHKWEGNIHDDDKEEDAGSSSAVELEFSRFEKVVSYLLEEISALEDSWSITKTSLQDAEEASMTKLEKMKEELSALWELKMAEEEELRELWQTRLESESGSIEERLL